QEHAGGVGQSIDIQNVPPGCHAWGLRAARDRRRLLHRGGQARGGHGGQDDQERDRGGAGFHGLSSAAAREQRVQNGRIIYPDSRRPVKRVSARSFTTTRACFRNRSMSPTMRRSPSTSYHWRWTSVRASSKLRIRAGSTARTRAAAQPSMTESGPSTAPTPASI